MSAWAPGSWAPGAWAGTAWATDVDPPPGVGGAGLMVAHVTTDEMSAALYLNSPDDQWSDG